MTGGNRGIGKAVCEALARRGLVVIVTARDEAEAQAVARNLPDARAIRMDVSRDSSVRAAADQAGPVDILVNNAAILIDEGEDLLRIDMDTVRDTFEANLLGVWRTCQAFIPGMSERGWGRVVNVSSGAGSFGAGLWSGAPAYSASKTGLNALTVMLAKELRGSGVLVNAVSPGLVKTRMAPYASQTPEEAAEGIVWLATLPDGGPSGGFYYERHPLKW